MPFLLLKSVDHKSLEFLDSKIDKSTLLNEIISLFTKPSKKAIIKFNSVIVGEDRAADIIKFYTENKPVGITNFTVKKEMIVQFQNKFSGISSQTGFGIGINIYIRRKDSSSGLFILFEPVKYKLPASGHVINHLKDIMILGKEAFLLNAETSNIIFERKNCDDEIKKYPLLDDTKMDANPVQRAFMPLIIFNEFTRNLVNGAENYKNMSFKLARNAKAGRITFVLSCFDDDSNKPISSKVTSDNTLYSGFYLDQHDLIPPPPDEE